MEEEGQGKDRIQLPPHIRHGRWEVVQSFLHDLSEAIAVREERYLRSFENDSEGSKEAEEDLLRALSLRDLYLRELDRLEYE